MTKRVWMAVGIFLLIGSIAWADDPTAQQVLAQHAENAQSFTWALVKMLFALVVVCALAYFSLRWLLPRLTVMPLRQAGILRVVHRLSLEQRKSLYIVQVLDGYHLIGVSDGSISYLTAVSAADLEARLGEAQKAIPGASKSFLDILQGKKT